MPSGSYSFQMKEGDVISKLEICLSVNKEIKYIFCTTYKKDDVIFSYTI